MLMDLADIAVDCFNLLSHQQTISLLVTRSRSSVSHENRSCDVRKQILEHFYVCFLFELIFHFLLKLNHPGRRKKTNFEIAGWK